MSTPGVWVLVVAMPFYSGHYKEHIEYLEDKEKCIEAAHQFYREYWSTNADRDYAADSVCFSQIIKKDYVLIYCDKSGSCITK